MDLLRAERRDLVGGPDVHPDDARPDRFALLVQAGERLALVGDADRLDVRAVDRLERLRHRHGARAPPILGVLLVPARSWKGQRELAPGLGDRAPVAVPHNGLGRGRRRVDADDVGHHTDAARAGSPPKKRLHGMFTGRSCGSPQTPRSQASCNQNK